MLKKHNFSSCYTMQGLLCGLIFLAFFPAQAKKNTAFERPEKTTLPIRLDQNKAGIVDETTQDKLFSQLKNDFLKTGNYNQYKFYSNAVLSSDQQKLILKTAEVQQLLNNLDQKNQSDFIQQNITSILTLSTIIFIFFIILFYLIVKINQLKKANSTLDLKKKAWTFSKIDNFIS